MTARHVVYTGGTFDLFHAGHVHLLRQCREIAGADGRVVVALNRDAFVQAYKGITPTHPYAERRQILEATRLVDVVVCNVGDADSKTAIEVVGPDVVAIGQDWHDPDAPDPWQRYRDQMGFEVGWLEDRGITLAALAHLPGWSATRIRRELGGR